MESKANYTVVGIAVLLLTAALLSTALWLSVGFDQKKYTIYAVYLNEAASGLSHDSVVRYNGVKVGYVKSIDLNVSDPQQVILLLAIEDNIPITQSTYATLISQGITGVSYVGLSANDSSLVPLQRQAGEPYPVIPSKPSMFNQLDKVLKNVSENINEVSMDIKKVFNKENVDNVQKTLANVENVSATLSRNSDNINKMLKSSTRFMSSMDALSKDFPALVRDLKQGVRKFNTMAEEVSAAGKNVSSAMNSGKLTMDEITHQTLPAMQLLFRRIDRITANLEKVSSQMRQNPAVLFRGSKPPQQGPGE